MNPVIPVVQNEAATSPLGQAGGVYQGTSAVKVLTKTLINVSLCLARHDRRKMQNHIIAQPDWAPEDRSNVRQRTTQSNPQAHGAATHRVKSSCCQTNANQSPLPLPSLNIRYQEGRATRRERRRGSSCRCRGSGDGAPSESDCGSRHALRRTSATFACAGTATSRARAVRTASVSFPPGC